MKRLFLLHSFIQTYVQTLDLTSYRLPKKLLVFSLFSLFVFVLNTPVSFGQNLDHTHTETELYESNTKGQIREIDFTFGDSDVPQTVLVNVIDGLVFLDGDILLGTESEIFNNAAIRNIPARVWPNSTMPYTIKAGYTTEELNMISYAINHVNSNSNLCLVPRTTETNYVEFNKDNGGCFSAVGMSGGMQVINVSINCGPGATIHEILHAAGHWHEQSRADRDTYVNINLGNVQSGKEHNFNKYNVGDGADVGPYDYGSIMHYNETAFSTNGQPTIEIRTPPGNNATDIGQRLNMSAGDIAAINQVYTANPSCTEITGLPVNLRIKDIGTISVDYPTGMVTVTGVVVENSGHTASVVVPLYLMRALTTSNSYGVASSAHNIPILNPGATHSLGNITFDGSGLAIGQYKFALWIDPFGTQTEGTTADNIHTWTLPTLTLPLCSTPALALGTITQPTNCIATDGSIQLTGLLASTAYGLNYKKDGASIQTMSITTDGSGNYTIAGLSIGDYTEINVDLNGCVSANLSQTLSTADVIPTFSLGTITNPTTCGYGDGSIQLIGLTASTNYSLTYTVDGVDYGPMAFTSDASGNHVAMNMIAGNYTAIQVILGICPSTPLTATLTPNYTPPAAANCQNTTDVQGLGGGFGGLMFIKIGTDSSATSTTQADAQNGYVDFTNNCEKVFTLTEGMTYAYELETWFNDHNIKAWIDYNNNNDYEAGELIFDANTTGNTNGGNDKTSGSFTVPASTVNGTHLKLRVLCEIGTVTDACYNPTYGQSENYPVYIVNNACTSNCLDVTSILRQSPTDESTDASQVTFRVTFSEAVQNVDATDFHLFDSNLLEFFGSISNVVMVNGNAAIYDVTVNGLGSTFGTLNLGITNGNNIQNLASEPLGDTPTISTEETYTITGNCSGAVSLTNITINPVSCGSSNDGSISVDAFCNLCDDFGGQLSYAIDGGSLQASNTFPNLTAGSHTITISSSLSTVCDIDTTVMVGSATCLSVTSILRQNPTDESTSASQVTFRVTFSEAVQNVDAADFHLFDSNLLEFFGSISNVVMVNGNAAVYDVTVDGLGSTFGTLNLSIANGNDIQNLSSTALGNNPTISTEETYTITGNCSGAVSLTSITINPVSCGSSNDGSISVDAFCNLCDDFGGQLSYAIDGGSLQASDTFPNLTAGSHTITISSSLSTVCDIDTTVTVGSAACQNATALDFDGANDYVDLGVWDPFTANGFTHEAWIYADNIGPLNYSNSVLIQEGSNGTSTILRIGEGNKVRASYHYGNDFYDLDGTISANNWHHLAMTWDGSTFSLYVDGNLAQSIPATQSPNQVTSNLYIGSSQIASGRYFDGEMDEVRIWGRALCQAEIQGQMDCELMGNETGLLAYYNFNQGVVAGNNTAITTLEDATNNHDGTLTDFELLNAGSNWIDGTANGVMGGCNTIACCDIAISSQPTSQEVCDGEDVTFTVGATSSAGGLNYQWQQICETEPTAWVTYNMNSAPSGLPANNIQDVHAINGKVYVATSTGGVAVADLANNASVWTVYSTSNGPTGFPSNQVNGIHVENGVIYAATNAGLATLDEANNATSWTVYSTSSGPTGFPDNNTREVQIYNGVIYVATSDGLATLDVANNATSWTVYSSGHSSGFPSWNVQDVFIDNGVVYVATGAALAVLDVANNATNWTIYSTSQGPSGFPSGQPNSIHYADGKIFASTFSTGGFMAILDVANNATSWTTYSSSGNDPSGFPGSTPTNIDSYNGVVYVSTISGGLVYLDYTNNASTWGKHLTYTQNPSGFPGNDAFDVFIEDGNIYAATSQGLGWLGNEITLTDINTTSGTTASYTFTPQAGDENCTYQVVITDANNCEITSEAVSFNTTGPCCDILVEEVLVTNGVCQGVADGIIDIAAHCSSCTGAVEYSLDGTNFQTNSQFAGLAAGDYLAQIRDVNNPTCTDTYWTTVTVQDGTGGVTINNQPTNQEVCEGEDVSFTVDASSSAGGLNYQWQTLIEVQPSWMTTNTSTSGFPANILYKVIEASGKLYVATFGGGLGIYDGTSWSSVNSSTTGFPANNNCFSVAEFQGKIYVTTLGGGLGVFDGTSWSTITSGNTTGFPANYLYDVFATNDKLLVATNGGLGIFDGTSWSTVNASNTTGFPNASCRNLYAVEDRIYVGTDPGGLGIFDGTSWSTVTDATAGFPGNNQVFSIYESPDGNIYAGTRTHGMGVYDGTSWTTIDSNTPNFPTGAIYDIEMINGKLYIAGGSAVGEFDGTSWTSINATNNPGFPNGGTPTSIFYNGSTLYVSTIAGLGSTAFGSSASDINGATNATYTFTPQTGDENNQYQVVITDANNCEVTSEAVSFNILTVQECCTQGPSFTCPSDQIIALNGQCELVVPDVLSGINDAVDNCTGNGEVTLSQSPEAGTTLLSADGAQQLVTITATDENGLITQCTMNLTGQTNLICTSSGSLNTVFLEGCDASGDGGTGNFDLTAAEDVANGDLDGDGMDGSTSTVTYHPSQGDALNGTAAYENGDGLMPGINQVWARVVDSNNMVFTIEVRLVIKISAPPPAQDSIPSGSYVSSSDIVTAGIVEDVGLVQFVAPTQITLLPGFRVLPGSEFIARIDATEYDPCEEVGLTIPAQARTQEAATTNQVERSTTVKVYPNPTRQQANVVIDLPEETVVNLDLYDMSGRKVTSLVNNTRLSAGFHQYEWDSWQVEPGMYILLLNGQVANKIVVIR